MRQRRLPADRLRDHVRDERGVRPQLLVLLLETVHRVDRTREGVARGVVTADEEDDAVTENLGQRKPLRLRAVRHQRHEVHRRLSGTTFLVQLGDRPEELLTRSVDLCLRLDDLAGARGDRHDVRPEGQLAATLLRVVEQRRERHRGELDRHLVDPVKLFTDR